MNSDNEFDDLDLDKLPGIFNDNFINDDLQYLKEDKIQIFPNITEKPIYPSQTKKLINEQINNANNINLNQKEEEILTFKNINIKKEKIKSNNYKYNNKSPIINNNHKRIEDDKINPNIMSFEELLRKNKNKNKKIYDLKDKRDNKKIKIDFSRKLYQNKSKLENEKEYKEKKIIKIKKNKGNEIINNLPHNKSEISMRTKKIYKQNKIEGKNKNNENEKILYNYFKLNNPSKKKSNIILNYKNKNIILNFENLNEQNKNKNKSFITEDNSRDTSLIMNKSSRTMKSKNNKKKRTNIMNEIDDKIKLILKKDSNKNIIAKRHSNMDNRLNTFDNSKFEKYDIEQMRYGLVKDYSFIHAEKDDNFLNRMEFDFMKRKNKEKTLNELVEKNKNKYKLNEAERKKAFNRLIDDANRRIIKNQELKENEKFLTDYKEIFDNNKKYNQEEWDKIYKKRFKDYEDIKNKKMDIQRQNEKIKKMIKEEEEINMCPKKKIPLREIKLSSERLYNDAKRRDFLKNNKHLINDKSSKNLKYYKNNICLTNINDEGEYSFLSERKNNLNKNKSNYIGKYNNYNKLYEKRKPKANNLRFNTENNNNEYNYQKNRIKNIGNNLNLKNNIMKSYFDFKKNKKKKNYDYLPSPTMPCEYNYNNFNIYNINNLNNNINSKFNNNFNEDIRNDDEYLFNITNQLIKSAALNKIDNNKNNNEYHQKLFNNEINTNNNFNNKESEGYQIIEQFLSSQFDNQN